jgi:hypothetical protein
LWVHPAEDNALIEMMERDLIDYYHPRWNIALKLR